MLALRMAERTVVVEETGEDPVLLLDDALQSLDEQRQARLLVLLERAQALVTVTDATELARIPSGTAVYRVAGGGVEIERAYTA